MLFANDTCLIAAKTDPNIAAQSINKDLQKITSWAQKWKVTFNPKKSKDMIFSNKVLNNSPPVMFNNIFVDRVNCHKHLGIYLTSNLDWSIHVHETCLKANRKLAVLRNVKFLHRNTIDLLYKLTCRSLIDYGLVVYGSTLTQRNLDRLERIQYRAAKIATGALHHSSKIKLNNDLGWESIKTRIDFLGLSLFHKINLGETRPLLTTFLPQRNERIGRQLGDYKKLPNYGVKFSNSFFPYFSQKWNTLPRCFRYYDLVDFKFNLKKRLKPEKQKHFSLGSKLGNKLLTRLRVGRSHLNSHSFAVGRVESPNCLCHAPNETVSHYFLECFLYTVERMTLFDLVRQSVDNFDRLTKARQLEILLFGYPDKEYSETNKTLTYNVQNYILQTNRFKFRR